MSNYTFTEEHRARLSESLKGVRNAVGPHQMSPQGRANLRLGQLRRWLKYYEEQGLTEKAVETELKIEQMEAKIKRYWGGK